MGTGIAGKDVVWNPANRFISKPVTALCRGELHKDGFPVPRIWLSSIPVVESRNGFR